MFNLLLVLLALISGVLISTGLFVSAFRKLLPHITPMVSESANLYLRGKFVSEHIVWLAAMPLLGMMFSINFQMGTVGFCATFTAASLRNLFMYSTSLSMSETDYYKYTKAGEHVKYQDFRDFLYRNVHNHLWLVLFNITVTVWHVHIINGYLREWHSEMSLDGCLQMGPMAYICDGHEREF